MFVETRANAILESHGDSKWKVIRVASTQLCILYDIRIAFANKLEADPGLNLFAFSNIKAAHEFVTKHIHTDYNWNKTILGDYDEPLPYTEGFPGDYCVAGRKCIWDNENLPWPAPLSLRNSTASIPDFDKMPYSLVLDPGGRYSMLPGYLYIVIQCTNGNAIANNKVAVTTILEAVR